MKSIVRFGEGVIGMTVELSIQDCIVLKGLVEELNDGRTNINVYSATHTQNLMENAANFINKIVGETVSLKESAQELFDIKPEAPVEPHVREHDRINLKKSYE